MHAAALVIAVLLVGDVPEGMPAAQPALQLKPGLDPTVLPALAEQRRQAIEQLEKQIREIESRRETVRVCEPACKSCCHSGDSCCQKCRDVEVSGNASAQRALLQEIVEHQGLWVPSVPVSAVRSIPEGYFVDLTSVWEFVRVVRPRQVVLAAENTFVLQRGHTVSHIRGGKYTRASGTFRVRGHEFLPEVGTVVTKIEYIDLRPYLKPFAPAGAQPPGLKAEEKAENALRLAQILVHANRRQAARERLTRLIVTNPETAAADEARELLAKLRKM